LSFQVSSVHLVSSAARCWSSTSTIYARYWPDTRRTTTRPGRTRASPSASPTTNATLTPRP